VAIQTQTITPDRVTRSKTETYQVSGIERALLIARLLFERKRSGSVHLNVSQGTPCNVQWEEKE
jgi:hypothetical protein